VNVATHLAKVDRYERALLKLDRDEDRLLWLWCLAASAMNAFNAALHAAGITDGRDCYPRRANRYLEPGDGPGAWVEVERPLGDAMHIGFPDVPGPLPDDIAHAAALIAEFDVRGDRPVTSAEVARWRIAYRDAVQALRRVATGGTR